MTEIIELGGTRYELDSMGYLLSPTRWDTAIRDWLAAQEKIELTPDHQKIVEYLRFHYLQNNEHPGGRLIIMALSRIFGKEKGKPEYFSELFPGGFNQAYKISGLPIRHSCC